MHMHKRGGHIGKNARTNLKRSTSIRLARVFFFFLFFFLSFFSRFCFQLKIHISSGKVKRQIDSFDRTLRIYIYIYVRTYARSRWVYPSSVHGARNKNINGELTIRQGGKYVRI